MPRTLQSASYSTAAFILILLALSSGSCSVRFVSDYDEKLDSAVTDLHTRIDVFLIKVGAESGTPAGEYDNNQEFYVDTQAAISSIRMRAESSPKNDVTVKQIESWTRPSRAAGAASSGGEGWPEAGPDPADSVRL